MDTVISIIMSIDPKILTIIAIVLVVLFILSLIKKMIKLAITALLIGAILLFVGPKLGEFQENYNIKVEEGIVYLTIDGNTHEFDLDACETISIEDIEGSKNCEVIVNPNTGSETSFEIPSIMKVVVKGFANSNDIEIVD